MTRKAIRTALEVHLDALADRPDILPENVDFPVPLELFLSQNLLFAEPDDRGFRNSPFIQRGLFIVGIHAPLGNGPSEADTVAETIADWFPRGSSFEADATITNIDRTPEISGGAIEEGRYVKRVTIRFSAQIDPVQV